jgi:hypothetical protein
MLNIKERPYSMLLFTAVALFIELVFPPVAGIDFQDKTMFNIPLAIVVWIIPLFLISIWMLYLLTKRIIYSLTLTRIHVILTVSTAILIAIVLYIGINPLQVSTNNYHDTTLTNRQELIGNAMQILFIIIVCTQFTFLINIILGLFKKNR